MRPSCLADERVVRNLPEVGDPGKLVPVKVFDEAHLLSDEPNLALEDKIEQVVRLIRSKGVGIYFITQNPVDIPEAVAGQPANRVQHALRAPSRRRIKRRSRLLPTQFRNNPALDVATAITELESRRGAGRSVLQEDGSPSIVQRTLTAATVAGRPAGCEGERAVIQSISCCGQYDTAVNRESVSDIGIRGQAAAAAAEAATAKAEADWRRRCPGGEGRG